VATDGVPGVSVRVPEPQITLSKSVENLTATAEGRSTNKTGDELLYTIEAGNDSSYASVWQNAIVTDNLNTLFDISGTLASVQIDSMAAGSAATLGGTGNRVLRVALGDLPNGTSRTITFKVKILPAAAGKTVSNVAVAEGVRTPDIDIDTEDAIRHTVTYHAEGGQGTVPAQSIHLHGENVVVASGSSLTREGYKFEGWAFTPGGQRVTSFTIIADVHLYALWSEVEEPYTPPVVPPVEPPVIPPEPPVEPPVTPPVTPPITPPVTPQPPVYPPVYPPTVTEPEEEPEEEPAEEPADEPEPPDPIIRPVETPPEPEVDGEELIDDVPYLDIFGTKIPLWSGGGSGAAWALLNLIMTIVCILIALVAMISYALRRRKLIEQQEAEPDSTEAASRGSRAGAAGSQAGGQPGAAGAAGAAGVGAGAAGSQAGAAAAAGSQAGWRNVGVSVSPGALGEDWENNDWEDVWRVKLLWPRLVATVLAIIAVLVFLLTEDVSLPMVLMDWWTIFHLVILILSIVFVVIAKKKSKENIEEEEDDDIALSYQ
jgi:hypothetical protein